MGESMSIRVSLRQLQAQLPELIDKAVRTGEEYVVQRDGKDWAVIVSARQWRRRGVGLRLDALGPAYRLAPKKQARIESLLAENEQRRLSPSEHRELKALLRECDSVMLRRTSALERLQ